MNYITDRTIAPAITNEYAFHFLEPECVILANGVTVYFIGGARQEVIRIELIYPAGNGYEPLNMLASVTNDLLGEGTSSRSAEEINEYLDFFGAYLSRETSRDHAMIGLFSLTKNLPQVLPVLHDLIMDSVYPEHELQIYLNSRKARFLDGMKKTDYVCRNQFGRLLFGDHPYGRPLRIDDFEHVTQDKVLSFYNGFYRSSTPVVFVAGHIGEAEKELITRSMESLSTRPFGEKIEDLPGCVPTREKIHLEGSLQSAIRIGRKIIGMEHPDYPSLAISNTVLGGYFGSRLMKNIREQKGYTYGIGSGISSFEKTAMLVIATEVGTEVTASAIDEIYKEIQVLRNQLIPEEELITVKNYLLGNFLKGIDGPFAQADKIKSKILRGLPANYYENYLEKIRQVNASQIRETVNQYMQPDTLSELIVGNV